MRKAFTYAAAAVAVAIDFTALVGGIMLGATSGNEWYFGYSIAAALAVFFAPLFFNLDTGRREADARGDGDNFAGQREAQERRLRAAHAAARPRPLPHHLMHLPVLACSNTARRRVA